MKFNRERSPRSGPGRQPTSREHAVAACFVGIALFAAPVGGQEHVLDANTLLLLHFNDNLAGAAGEMPTSSSGVSFQGGIFGSGAYVPASNQVYFQRAENLDATSGTLEFWIKPGWAGNDNASHTVLRCGGAGGVLVEKDGGNFWNILLDLWTPGMVSAGHFVTNEWTAGQWHHSAFTWNDSSVKAYIDGSLVAETVPSIPLPAITDATFQLGANGAASFLGAVLDELRISDRERSPEEIAASYVAGLTVSSLWMEPSYTWAFPGWRVPVELKAGTNLGVVSLPLCAATWSSTDPLVASYEAGDRVDAISPGLAFLIANVQGVQAALPVDVQQAVLEPVHDPVPAFLATPAANCRYEIPVLILRYLPTVDGVNLDLSVDPDFYTLNPITLATLRARIDSVTVRAKFALEEGSRFRAYNNPAALPAIGYRVLDVITVYEPTPPGQSRVVNGTTTYTVYEPDYSAIFERFGVEQYVNGSGVGEIWFWTGGMDPSYPSYDERLHDPVIFRQYPESNMSSPVTGDISNSWRYPLDLPIYDRTYVVYGYNFRRGTSEALENHMHQIEHQLTHVNVLRDGSDDLFWHKFVGQNEAGQFITGRCGWSHMPPNTTINYDWFNPTLVASDIEDWRPDHTGATTLVNVNTWGNRSYSWPWGETDFLGRISAQWFIYWMQSVPGLGNAIPYDTHRLTNWWSFIGDWDGAMVAGAGLHAPSSAVAAPEPGKGEVAAAVRIQRVRPNPFVARTEVIIDVLEEGIVHADIHDVHGRRIITLARVSMPAGQCVLAWDGRARDGSRVAAGLYFLRVRARDAEEVRKIVRLR